MDHRSGGKEDERRYHSQLLYSITRFTIERSIWLSMLMTVYEGPLLVPMRSHHKGLEEERPSLSLTLVRTMTFV